MPNAEKVAPDPKEISIEIGGKNRRLVCDMWALAMMETASGESAMYGRFFQEMTMNKLVTVVWACLLEDPEVAAATEKQGVQAGRKLVAKWVDFSRFDELFDACKRAFESVAVKTSGQDEGNAQAAQTENGTGSST